MTKITPSDREISLPPISIRWELPRFLPSSSNGAIVTARIYPSQRYIPPQFSIGVELEGRKGHSDTYSFAVETSFLAGLARVERPILARLMVIRGPDFRGHPQARRDKLYEATIFREMSLDSQQGASQPNVLSSSQVSSLLDYVFGNPRDLTIENATVSEDMQAFKRFYETSHEKMKAIYDFVRSGGARVPRGYLSVTRGKR